MLKQFNYQNNDYQSFGMHLSKHFAGKLARAMLAGNCGIITCNRRSHYTAETLLANLYDCWTQTQSPSAPLGIRCWVGVSQNIHSWDQNIILKDISYREMRRFGVEWAEQGYIDVIKGYWSSYNDTGRQTLWAPTPKLIAIMEQFESILNNPTDDMAGLSVRSTSDKKINRIDQKRTAILTNIMNKSVPLEINGLKIKPNFYQLQKRATNGTYGGRIYWQGINTSKEERQMAKINGNPAIELDFKANHISLLYIKEGLDIPYEPYDVPLSKHLQIVLNNLEYRKDLIKMALMIMLNTGSPGSALSALVSYSRGRVCTVSNTFRPRIPVLAHQDAVELISILAQYHRKIGHYFYQNVGLELMGIEGQVCLEVMNNLSKAGITVYPLHDSMLCEIHNEKAVRDEMIAVVVAKYGRAPRIVNKTAELAAKRIRTLAAIHTPVPARVCPECQQEPNQDGVCVTDCCSRWLDPWDL